MASGGKLAVLAALFGNAMVTVFKFIAAILSGSSSMFAEAYHSVSDTFNQVFLLIGIAKSKKKPWYTWSALRNRIIFEKKSAKIISPLYSTSNKFVYDFANVKDFFCTLTDTMVLSPKKDGINIHYQYFP